jgi:acetolactate synthase-1/2/3 large subunit
MEGGAQLRTRVGGGELFLRALAGQGITRLFGNAGTDFAPIIEAYAALRGEAASAPLPVTVPHENLAVAMAHGAYLASGWPQAVMVHVGVGTANALCGLFNAARENVPLLLLAGRTPLTERGAVGSRNAFIHWAQEMFDQAGMVRELVKWDYEVKRADQLEAAVARALSIAMAEPRGPVYLSLPREVLAADEAPSSAMTAAAAVPPEPSPEALGRVSSWLDAAKRPLLITAGLGRAPREAAALKAFAERREVPVVAYRPRYAALPQSHPAHAGYDPAALLGEADLVLVVACDVPWLPAHHAPDPHARVAHIGFDPDFARYPMRCFRSDLGVAGDPAAALEHLAAMGKARLDGGRASWFAQCRARFLARLAPVPEPPAASGPAWLAQCLATAVPDALLVCETALPLERLQHDRPGHFFGAPSAGGLGWSLGAALGAKLERPAARVVAVVGDGGYMFGNPTAAHFVGRALELPTLTVVVNNRMWAAVRRATLAVYPAGAAASDEDPAFTRLEPSPDYEKIVAASGGYGEKVEQAAALPGALARALHAVDAERRPAVLNVITEYGDEEARRDALQ